MKGGGREGEEEGGGGRGEGGVGGGGNENTLITGVRIKYFTKLSILSN